MSVNFFVRRALGHSGADVGMLPSGGRLRQCFQYVSRACRLLNIRLSAILIGVLEASTRFFCEDYQGGRTFIESVIRDHAMWSKEEFWEKLMEICLVQAPTSAQERHEFVLDWLMNTAHMMLTFGVAPEIVTQTAVRMATHHDLPGERVDEIRKFIRNAAQAMAPID